jgi:hypothetical protein
MDETQPRQDPGIGLYLFFCALAALWIDLGSLHRWHNGDSLMPVLVSLQYWTPFQWELDRHGMLVPLLALPVAHPLANLLVQGFLDVFCGLAAFFLLARYILRDSVDPLAGALGATAFLILAPAPYRFEYFMDVSYGVWLTLGLGGLLVAEPEPGVGARTWGRRLVALVLIILAHWVYGATVLYLGTLVVFRTLFAGRFRLQGVRRLKRDSFANARLAVAAGRILRSAPAQAILLLVAGFLAGMALTKLSIHHPTTFARIPPRGWPHAWTRMVEQTWLALAPGTWLGVLTTVAVLAVVVNLVCAAPGSTIPWREAAALLSTALLVALYMGTRLWLKLNDYAPRYLLPSLILVQAALSILIVKPLGGTILARARSRLPAVVAALLLLGVAPSSGVPSLRRVRTDLDRLSVVTPDVLATGCTHIAGDYWTVWPAVFHVNLTLRERGESRTVWGVTYGAQPTSMVWRTIPQDKRCVCIPVNDPYGDNWLISFGFSRFRDVQRRPTVRVLHRQPAVSAARPNP